jgi:prevent-host-death family protein
MPMQVGIREAKAKLSALVGRTRRGDVITITDHGRPVARLVPVPDSELSLDERLLEMERRGQVSPQPAGPCPLPAPLSLGSGDLAQRLLQEDRDGGG